MPLFSRQELDRLCRPPEQRLRSALRDGTAEDVLACFRRMLSFGRGLNDLYGDWSVTVLCWLRERHGVRAAGEAAFFHEMWPADTAPSLNEEQLAFTRSVLRDEDGEELDRQVLRLAAAAAASGDPRELLAFWQRVHGACDRATILRRDALTAQLTLVNGRYGSDEYEDCLRYTAEILFVPRMEHDLGLPPRERLANWAERMSAGLNGAVHIEEFEDRWVLWLDPCGSCGRQVLDRRYEPPWNFGLVQDGVAIGFGRPDITVYQAHLAVMHTLVPIERTGAPWPAIACRGLTPGPCELALYKDPGGTAERFYSQVGLSKAGRVTE
jgi:hypothetical protein